MSDNVIKLGLYRNPGNGAREALQRYFEGQQLAGVDHLLAWLWINGFKVVPLDVKDEAHIR